MKVHELISQLQKCDPNTEVVVGGSPVVFIEEQPGYYDGHYEVYTDKPEPKFLVTNSGKKVNIFTYSFEDALWDYENLKIDIEGDAAFKSYIESKILKIKKEIKENI